MITVICTNYAQKWGYYLSSKVSLQICNAVCALLRRLQISKENFKNKKIYPQISRLMPNNYSRFQLNLSPFCWFWMCVWDFGVLSPLVFIQRLQYYWLNTEDVEEFWVILVYLMISLYIWDWPFKGNAESTIRGGSVILLDIAVGSAWK